MRGNVIECFREAAPRRRQLYSTSLALSVREGHPVKSPLDEWFSGEPGGNWLHLLGVATLSGAPRQALLESSPAWFSGVKCLRSSLGGRPDKLLRVKCFYSAGPFEWQSRTNKAIMYRQEVAVSFETQCRQKWGPKSLRGIFRVRGRWTEFLPSSNVQMRVSAVKSRIQWLHKHTTSYAEFLWRVQVSGGEEPRGVPKSHAFPTPPLPWPALLIWHSGEILGRAWFGGFLVYSESCQHITT